MRRSALILFVLFSLLCLAACGNPAEKPKDPVQDGTLSHTHVWEPANCSRGEFCFGCGETQGEALAHVWVDATCDKAKHCTLCGMTEGAMLAHVSDGNGSCAVCKRELNIYAWLNGARPSDGSVVYGGVVLRFAFWGFDGETATSGRFGKDYKIYDQSGALVAEGAWNQKVPVVWDPHTHNTDPEYHDTEHIPLPPGKYRVEYDYYEDWQGIEEYENNDPLSPNFKSFLIPERGLSHSSNQLEVR